MGRGVEAFAFGEDDRPLELGDEVKSISSENTFLHDTDDRPTLRGVSERSRPTTWRGSLAKRRLAAHTVQVKMRYGDFTTLTRQIIGGGAVDGSERDLPAGLLAAGAGKTGERPLRLLGLGVSGLVEARASQLRLPLESLERSRV